MIEHIERPLQAKYIAVAHHLLRPGGHLILTTPNADTMRAMPMGGREWSNQPLEEWLGPHDLIGLLEQQFDVCQLRSIIPGHGTRGPYRVANSAKIRHFMHTIGVGSAWESLGLRYRYGLHLVAHAQKPHQT